MSQLGFVEKLRVSEPLPVESPRRSRDLSAWWSDADREKAVELRDGIRQTQSEQALLARKEADIRFRVKKAAELEREAELRRVKMALGEIEGIDIPTVESTTRIERLALERIEVLLAEARDNEKELNEKLRAHFLASNRRAAITVYREKYEVAAKELAEARALLAGAHLVAQEAGTADIVHLPLFSQCVIPCEPGLSAVERKYVQVNMAPWFIHGQADSPADAQAVALRARADFQQLVGSDINIRWHR